MKNSIILICILFISCNQKNQLKSINQASESIIKLKNKVMHQGDIEAYETLETAYLDHPTGELLPYAMIMANKYDYPKAYLDVYEILGNIYNCSENTDTYYFDLDCVNENVRKRALEYLEKAVDKGNKSAMYSLGHMLIDGKYYPRDEVRGNNFLVMSR